MPLAPGGAPATSSPLNNEFAMCDAQGIQMQGTAGGKQKILCGLLKAAGSHAHAHLMLS